jgi:hypothetical protein
MISADCVAGHDRGKGLPVLSARQFIEAATTALSLITGAFFLVLAAGNARAQGSALACDAADRASVLAVGAVERRPVSRHACDRKKRCKESSR